MICEIKHYPSEEKPYGMWVNNEYVSDYATILEAVAVYEDMLRKNRVKELGINESGVKV